MLDGNHARPAFGTDVSMSQSLVSSLVQLILPARQID